ncbi:uncharacterized protein METZ01_LOCUS158663 [marine metagenome]|uniref:Uncharacterized protein n=1 Tax=marine metagenome TaxID=408172 RepID=A0A382AWH9_9ZZZZ
MEDGESAVSVSPSGGRMDGCPHNFLYFLDGVDLDRRSLMNYDHTGLGSGSGESNNTCRHPLPDDVR